MDGSPSFYPMSEQPMGIIVYSPVSKLDWPNAAARDENRRRRISSQYRDPIESSGKKANSHLR
ncbi:MAG: hypothetical protein ACREP6_10355 [Candidatus Binataceae bacterium]